MYQAVIVDDEPFIVDGLTKAIDWSDFHIEIGFASTDPVKALEYILAHPVDIVITDVSMPVLNGLQLIQQIKAAKPPIYIIVLSAYNNFEYTRAALRQGAENYLLKPLDPDELSDTIRQIISHIKERDQLNSTYGRAMMTFRNAFTEQWLKNLLTNADLSTRAELLGINLDASNFTVVIISCLSSPDVVMSHFFDLFLRYLPGHYTGNFFFETQKRLVGVLSPVDGNTENLSAFLIKIMKAASNSGLLVFMSIGCTVTHYSHVHQSYHQADSFAFFEYTRLPYIFYSGDSSISLCASEALEHYNQTNGTNTELINKLYQSHSPSLCTSHLLSKRIGELCKKEYEISDKYPELVGILFNLPLQTASMEEQLSYTLQFLQSSNYILKKIKQSMYPCVDAVIKIVHGFSDKDISLKTLAAKLNINPSYLGTIFHQQTGYYFNDYLTEARLKYAANLLEDTDMKIKDIVEKIGFSSQTYFNRSFKRHYDTSPVNYRRDKKVDKLSNE